MNDIDSFIKSGILEMYVLGNTSQEESERVAQMAIEHSEVRDEIDAICIALEQYGRANAIEPNPTVLPFLMATINYMERLKGGEQPLVPPMLHKDSKVEDYAQWLNRPDLQLDEKLEDAYAHIIGYTPECISAIVWLKHGAPPETHTNELEKFLIVEGSCNITIDKTVHSMRAGDVLIVPLYSSHYVAVTSACPCKLILQRAAA